MTVGENLYNLLFLLGSYALIYMAVNAINLLRDGLRMTWFSSLVKRTLENSDKRPMLRLGMVAMLSEGDTMRVASALLGFNNGRVINHSETVRALLAATSCKLVWVLLACLITYMSTNVDLAWIIMCILGVAIILSRANYRIDMTGRFVFYIGVLLLGVLFSVSAITNMASANVEIFKALWQYTAVSDVVGIVISGFVGVIVGALLSGNFLGIFMVLPFVMCGLFGVGSAVSFVAGTEVGTLFPMSMMAAGTTLQSRRSFLYYAIVITTVWVLGMILLAILKCNNLSNLGLFGFAITYTVLFSFMIFSVYHLIGVKLWSKVSEVVHEENKFSKRHLHKFGEFYSPHISLLLIQAEKEIVNLQFRIHKMLDFTIDLIDGEDVEGSLEHIRKYRTIVLRTGREITDFIVTQTSMKNNEHVSEIARERLRAVDLQCQLGNIFCDMAEAIRCADTNDYPIIRRCVVSLETLYNQATKLINKRFNSRGEEGAVLQEDVEELSRQVADLLQQYGHNPVTDVLPYSIIRSRQIIVDIIENLQ